MSIKLKLSLHVKGDFEPTKSCYIHTAPTISTTTTNATIKDKVLRRYFQKILGGWVVHEIKLKHAVFMEFVQWPCQQHTKNSLEF